MKTSKRMSRDEVLANMTSMNFRIDRVPSTPAEMRHARKRLRKLTYGRNMGRIAVMTNPFKLIATIRACHERGMKIMQDTARRKLNIVLDVASA